MVDRPVWGDIAGLEADLDPVGGDQHDVALPVQPRPRQPGDRSFHADLGGLDPPCRPDP